MLDALDLSWQSAAAAAALLCAFAVSLGLVLTKKHHGRLTFDSTVGVQKFHAEPTPRVGGIGIYLGLLFAWSVVREKGVRDILGIVLLAGLVPLACGLAEDVTKRVGVLPRLLATMAAGVLASLLTGTALNRVDVYGIDWLMALAPVAVLFTAFAVGGVANAINIIDGFHGLASGTTMIALVALAAIANRAADTHLSIACLVMAAAVGGFWLVNYPWGKLFMGDGGAYFSGFALAWLAVLLTVRNPSVSVWAALLVCAYPVIEVLYSIIRRARSRQSPGSPDSGHLHSLVKTKFIRPKLTAMGVPTAARNAAVSPLMWAFAGLPAMVATALFNQSMWLIATLVACVGIYHVLYRFLDAKELVAPEAITTIAPEFVPQEAAARRTHHRQRSHGRRAIFTRE